MTTHPLHTWCEYLSNDNYTSLITYVENINQNIDNNSILLLVGEGPTGKSTLLKDIQKYIETNKGGVSGYQDINNLDFHQPFSPITIFINQNDAWNGRFTNVNNPKVRGILNFIKFKLNGILIQNNLHNIPEILLQMNCFTIIEMNHHFI